jgi:hypothetical protein
LLRSRRRRDRDPKRRRADFLLFFYTNVVLLDAWLAGLALAIGRV